ncbi:FAD-dependent oxidoreductase [Limnohabitans sp. MMS-10A-160]|jgi:3-(3-hydroxy-phenyl)propionate hydroxylase|uniref:FAD-dependent oxidoreductase n=1 Tax=unclassified Limnohabitans TaxID=2626134 RepID=UPI000D3D8A38|nr:MULTISPECIES: FAD-dependent oxidoreductase [unclassified Limnohabitans]PUE20523.1 FAD-dependent oxidoreductase [Limnohabitans sp. MMS-10A-192]PUE25089.1 FAD-dependent oxidoreductase [Limnohabitans sp. MMS-10A-160]
MKLDDLPLHELRGTGEQVQAIQFPYVRSPDQDAAQPARHPIVIVGAGPVGLSAAIDLAQRGQPVLVVDNDDRLSFGSRALCFAKRTLEIWDRLGVGDSMVDKGVSWNVGKVFLRDEQVYQFNLLPESAHERPAFINLQQYYCEAYLVERALQLPNIEIRWKNNLTALQTRDDGALLTLDTPEGSYQIDASWVIACDGGRSPVRNMMGLDSKGRIFQDRFLIADVKMKADFPTERWFWFDPPFHRNQSVLLHREPDNVWRIDFQLGWDADPEEEKKPENIMPRVQAMLGKDVEFTLEWASVYTFACLRMDKFVHGRVIFAGDAAHGVSPFGARGANSGVQDADNLAWKLDWVLKGRAGVELLNSYGTEREYAADENILNSTRATDFITPKSEISRMFRDQVLGLARDHEFARRIVNSGRLSVPATLHETSLNTPDVDAFKGRMVPGAPLTDAPVQRASRDTWLLRSLGPEFTLLVFGDAPSWAPSLSNVTVLRIGMDLLDTQGLLAQRLDATPGTAYLIRPDQHVSGRWRKPNEEAVRAALAKTTCTQI